MLDLATIIEGDASLADAFKRSLLYAQQAEELGYTRYWFAEHHNMESVASSATSVLIGHIAQGTSRIRVGSGGVMLPNHAPLIIAEQFGTLASLYPGFEASNWYAVFAPAKTPPAIVNKLSAEIARTIRLPDVQKFMASEGADPVGSSPQEFAAFFRQEIDRYAKVIKAANIRLD